MGKIIRIKGANLVYNKLDATNLLGITPTLKNATFEQSGNEYRLLVSDSSNECYFAIPTDGQTRTVRITFRLDKTVSNDGWINLGNGYGVTTAQGENGIQIQTSSEDYITRDVSFVNSRGRFSIVLVGSPRAIFVKSLLLINE